MRHLRNAALVVLALSVASAAEAQRRVNTGGAQAAPKKAWEIGFDIATLRFVADDPQSLTLRVMSQTIRGALFLQSNVALDGRLAWFSRAQKQTPGQTSFGIDFGVLYGLTDLEPGTKAMYLRPGVMINWSSTPGSRSVTTLSGAFGMRKPWHGVIWTNEIQLNNQLESGPVASALYFDLRAGINIRL